jgi:corrinoid protein of di/trimethylamine methyltransferase
MAKTLEELRVTTSENPVEQLKKAVVTYDAGLAANAAQQAVQQGLDPVELLDGMTEAVRFVGDAFAADELWLPDLVGSAEAMSAATPIIEEEIKRRGASRETLGTVVIGTVYGDIHSIGKTMVAAMLVAEGFDVQDLGINVTAGQFVEAVKEYDAAILAMSALLTTTAPEQRKVIDALRQEGIRERVKIMVGGGAITADFAESIGADGYDPTAPGAAKVAWRLAGQ